MIFIQIYIQEPNYRLLLLLVKLVWNTSGCNFSQLSEKDKRCKSGAIKSQDEWTDNSESVQIKEKILIFQ